MSNRGKARIRAGLAVFALLTAVACLPPNGVPESSEAAVRRTVESLIAADNTEDLESVLAHYSEDAVLLPPAGPPVHGRRNIGPRYRDLFADYDVELEVTIAELGVADEWAWCRGTTTGRFVPRSGRLDAVRRVHDEFLMVLAVQPNGSWRIEILAWSPARARGGTSDSID